MKDILLQIAQVAAVLVSAPLLQGIIVQFEERVQRGQGPGIFQPYRDLWKLFHKEQVVPQSASWLYWIAPVVAFTCMLTVPILIPVLTDYPLPLSDMGDILGGGLILTLGAFILFPPLRWQKALHFYHHSAGKKLIRAKQPGWRIYPDI